MIPSNKHVGVLVVLAAFLAGIGVGSLGDDVLAWRLEAYGKKLFGYFPELRWSELFAMTSLGSNYGFRGAVEANTSLYAAIENPHDDDSDIYEGERLFAEHCALCHGADAGGGLAPSLLRPSYSHGDSPFAVYRVVRDGIPQTAMAAPPLSPVQRWQVVAYLRSAQQGRAAGFDPVPLEPIDVSSEAVLTAGTRKDEWLTYSGNLKGWRYSELVQLTPDNVSRLRPVWRRHFDSPLPGQSATPLVVNGTILVSESPSNAIAVNARTGQVLWRFERSLPNNLPVCCGAVNRGLAVLNDMAYIATLDARLFALDANTGEVRWETGVADPANGYAMTVAPLIVGDLVVVGVSGGEFGIRGFLAAYDAATGVERWRFVTIPGPGEPGHETWLNDAWRTGGGPTWVTGSYDAELDLLYWGVGNPSPDFQGDLRPGDNLYTNSVVAVRGSTGELVWYFQFTPHDERDWDSNQTPILTELEIDGRMRRVIYWANRNGHYYVLDRETGEFLKGVAFVRQNWTKGLDDAGRPVPAEAEDALAAGRRTYPGTTGGTNWYPPAFDPSRQLVFVHALEQGSVFTQAAVEEVEYQPGMAFLGSGVASTDMPDISVRALRAATGEIAWIYEEPPLTEASGITGLLATAGGLVFGGSGGRLFALDSSTGREMWSRFLDGNTQAPPITFTLDGRQVVLVWGGRTLFLFAL